MKGIIVNGMGRVNGYLLNILNQQGRGVNAVVSLSCRKNDTALSIQQRKSESDKSVPAPEYSCEIPAFTNMAEAIKKLNNDGIREITVIDASTPENFRSTVNVIYEIAKNSDNSFFLCSCTPDQDGKTQDLVQKINLPNMLVKRDDFKSDEIQEIINANYEWAKQINGKLIITDVHRAEKEPWAAVLKYTVEQLAGKPNADAAYRQAMDIYDLTLECIDKRTANPVKVNDNLEVSSVCSIKNSEMECDTAFIIECLDSNGTQSTINKKGERVSSIVLATEKIGKKVAKDLIALSK